MSDEIVHKTKLGEKFYFLTFLQNRSMRCPKYYKLPEKFIYRPTIQNKMRNKIIFPKILGRNELRHDTNNSPNFIRVSFFVHSQMKYSIRCSPHASFSISMERLTAQSRTIKIWTRKY